MNMLRGVPHDTPSGVARAGHFLQHFGEMMLAMIVGMAAAAVVLVVIFSSVLAAEVKGLTSEEVLARYPVLVCLVVAAGMVGTMAAWMRYRGMAGRPVAEMSTAMVVPLPPIFGLLALDVIAGASACGLYCLTMIPAMAVAMLFRLDLYTRGHADHG
jgi:hypothetical protein